MRRREWEKNKLTKCLSHTFYTFLMQVSLPSLSNLLQNFFSFSLNFYQPIQCLHFSLQILHIARTIGQTIKASTGSPTTGMYVCVCVCLLCLLCCMLWRRLRANKFNLQRVGELRQVFAAFIIASTSRRQGQRMKRERGIYTAPNETPFTNLFIYIRRIYFITRSKCSRAESAATGKKKEGKKQKEKEAERGAKRCCMKRPN